MVNRLVCPKCGLVNFASATECKRCRFKFIEAGTQADIRSKPASTISAVPDQLRPELKAEDSALQDPGPANEPTGTSAPLPEYFNDEPAPYSVGMILFAITVGLSFLMAAYQLQQYYRLYGGEEWKALTNTRSRVFVPLFEYLALFDWIINVLVIFASVLLMVLFLRKSYAFLRWVLVYLVANVIFLMVDGWAGLQIESTLREKHIGIAFDPYLDQLHWYVYLHGVTILVIFVWFRYFTASERVKETFKN